jgi:hypothetical protein
MSFLIAAPAVPGFKLLRRSVAQIVDCIHSSPDTFPGHNLLLFFQQIERARAGKTDDEKA